MNGPERTSPITSEGNHDLAQERRTTGSPRTGGEELSIARGLLTFVAILGVVLALWLIVRLQTLVVLVLISSVLAAGLAPAVAWIQGLRLPRGSRIPRTAAILLVYAAAGAALLGATAVIVVPVVQESIRFSQNLPEYLTSLEQWLERTHRHYPWAPDYPGLVSKAQSQLAGAGRYVVGSAPAVFGFLGSVVSGFSVLVITFYILSSYETMRDGFLAVVPPKHADKARHTAGKMARAMGGWLRGQLMLAGTMGLAAGVAAFVFGVPYPFVIGVVAAVGDLIPMVGPVAAAVPAVLLTIGGPVWKPIALVVVFALLAQAEGNYLAPRIMQKHVGLSPLVTITALLAGASLLGIVGALLAIPVAAALQVLFVEVIAPAIRGSGEEH